MIPLLFLLTLTAPLKLSALRTMRVAYNWTFVDFKYPSESARQQAIATGQFDPTKNVITGVDVWKGNGSQKIFVSIAKLAPGCPVTLSTVTNQTRNGTTLLKPYPDWGWQGSCDGLMSVYRVRVDKCNRLWVLDSGVYQDTKMICQPKIVVFDLKTDKVIRKYTFPAEIVQCNSYLVNIVVDVRGGNCADSFAMIADVAGFILFVYSMKSNSSWVIKQDYFYPDPCCGYFKINGVQVDLMDGILGLALGPVKNNDRLLYYHSLSKLQEGWVKTSVVRNGSFFGNNTGASRESFQISKEKRKSQCSLQDMTNSDILLFGMPVENAIGCWNMKFPFSEMFMDRPEKDDKALQYVSDLKVVDGNEVWVVTNRLQNFYYGTIPGNETNYRIIVGKVEDLVKNTKCDPRWFPTMLL